MNYMKLWEEFPKLVERIREDHKHNNVAEGHDFFHTLLVAQYGVMIAEENRLKILAWVAGICHNTDKIFPELSDDEVEKKVWEYLGLTGMLIRLEKRFIVEAVLCHSEKNKDNDSVITVLLKDADRLAGAGILCAVRAGSHLYNFPAFKPWVINGFEPEETFQNIRSVLSGMRFTLEWREMLRCTKAIELGKKYFAILEQSIKDLELQLKESQIDSFLE